MGITRACGLLGISRSLFAYESKRTDDVALTERMKEMATLKRRYGYRRIHILLRREGWQTNHKRVWRLYSQAGLSVRKRRRKRIAPAERVVRPVATAPNQSWSMDFVSDGLAYGRRFRCLNIVDDYTRECLAIEVDTSLPGLRVAQVLQRLAELEGPPMYDRGQRPGVCRQGFGRLGQSGRRLAVVHQARQVVVVKLEAGVGEQSQAMRAARSGAGQCQVGHHLIH